MSFEDKLRVVEQALEAFNSHDMDGFVSFMSESVVNYMPGRSEPLRGPIEVRDDNIAFVAAYPDVRFEKTGTSGEGDLVHIDGIVKGTHEGPLRGLDGKPIPPTYKQVQVPARFTVRVENSKITEIREYLDQLEFFRQLGLAE